jgi:hypothetical protein
MPILKKITFSSILLELHLLSTLPYYISFPRFAVSLGTSSKKPLRWPVDDDCCPVAVTVWVTVVGGLIGEGVVDHAIHRKGQVTVLLAIDFVADQTAVTAVVRNTFSAIEITPIPQTPDRRLANWCLVVIKHRDGDSGVPTVFVGQAHAIQVGHVQGRWGGCGWRRFGGGCLGWFLSWAGRRFHSWFQRRRWRKLQGWFSGWRWRSFVDTAVG